MEGINFGEFCILITIRQMETCHFIALCTCSMAHGHKFAKLKPANHQNFVIYQIFSPPKLTTIPSLIIPSLSLSLI